MRALAPENHPAHTTAGNPPQETRMTEELFREDATLLQCDAEVLAVDELPDGTRQDSVMVTAPHEDPRLATTAHDCSLTAPRRGLLHDTARRA